MKLKSTSQPLPRLAHLEREVVAESREWGVSVSRSVCNNSPMSLARFFPLKQRRRRPFRLRSELGKIELVVDYGQAPCSGRWGCPLREQWQLGPHEKITPGFAEKLCFTATATGSWRKRRRAPANGRKPWMTPPCTRWCNVSGPGRKARRNRHWDELWAAN